MVSLPIVRQAPHMEQSLLQGRDGLGMGRPTSCLLSKTGQILDSLAGLVSLRVVVRQAVIGFLQTVGVESFQGLTGRRMEGLAAGNQKALVGHFLCQGVFENIDWLPGFSLFIKKLQLLQLPEMRLQNSWSLPDRLQEF